MRRGTSTYAFNTMQDVKSHSSQLFNERMAILFYLLDMKSIELNENPQSIQLIKTVRSINMQIYKNFHTLILNNPVMRNTLNLNTNEDGVYVTDIILGTIDKMYYFCENTGYTFKRCHVIVNELNKFEMLMKHILQYHSYFVRPNFIQKPDIIAAAENYRLMADKMTLEQLREVAGKNNKIDFDDIGISETPKIDGGSEEDDEGDDVDEEEVFEQFEETETDETGE